MDQSISRSFEDRDEEILLQEFSVEEQEQRKVEKNNSDLVFRPKFIPFYPDIQEKHNLSHIESLVFGFIDFYMNSGVKRFYFTDEQISKVVGCGESTAGKAINKLKSIGLINLSHKVRAGGGKIRFILPVVNSTVPSRQFDGLESSNLRGNNNKINNNNINIYIQVLEHWNSKKIITHKKVTDEIKRKINGKINNGFTQKEIMQAISNYATIIHGQEYFFKYKWTLVEFLQRGLEKFLDLDIAKSNYLKNKNNFREKDFESEDLTKYDNL